jgi:hypothetical protein
MMLETDDVVDFFTVLLGFDDHDDSMVCCKLPQALQGIKLKLLMMSKVWIFCWYLM